MRKYATYLATVVLMALLLWFLTSFFNVAHSQVVFEPKVEDVEQMCAEPIKHGILGCARSGIGSTWVMETYEKTLFKEKTSNKIVGQQGKMVVRIIPMFGSVDRYVYQLVCNSKGVYTYRYQKISGSAISLLNQLDLSKIFQSAMGLDLEDAVPGNIPYDMAAWLCSDEVPITETVLTLTASEIRKEEAKILEREERLKARAQGKSDPGIGRIE